MINFKDKNQALASGLLVAALAIALGTMVYMFAVPIPTVETVQAAEKKKEDAAEKDISRAQADLKERQHLITSYAFTGRDEDAEASTLDRVTKLTVQRKLKLLGFRPQRGIDAGQLTQLPFLVSVSGKFADVVGFTRDLESNGTRLAVNLVQLAASDQSTDVVTANINVVGYLNTPFGNGTNNG